VRLKRLEISKHNSTMGALHRQDIPLIFGGADGLGKVMQTAWGNFTKEPERALDRLGWPGIILMVILVVLLFCYDEGD